MFYRVRAALSPRWRGARKPEGRTGAGQLMGSRAGRRSHGSASGRSDLEIEKPAGEGRIGRGHAKLSSEDTDMAGSEWFSIEIASQPANVLSALLDEFARAWAAIGAPKGVAMFLAGKPGRD